MDGARVWKIANGSSTYYINDPTGKTEAVQQGIYSSSYTYNIWGTDNIGQIVRVGGRLTRYYYLKDHLGSIKMTVDASGNVVGYNDYYPFGMTMPGRSYVSSADPRYQFTSKERDAESGLDYFGARYYDSWRGQWLAADPKAGKYPSLSPYNYAADNPLKFVDPNGMDLDDYHFDTQGNMIRRDIRPGEDRYFIEEGSGSEQEICLDSDLGQLIRVTYAEMGGADDNSKTIVAESVQNRTELPNNTFEKGDSYGDVINSGAYNAANNGDRNYTKYSDPQSVYKKNELERTAFVNAAAAAIKVQYGKSGNIGKGVIWYDSNNSSRMDKNKKVSKIKLDVTADGIAGAWKYKDKEVEKKQKEQK